MRKTVFFLLRHFGHRHIAVICLTKLSITVFLAYILRHSDRNDLIFFRSFQKNFGLCPKKIQREIRVKPCSEWRNSALRDGEWRNSEGRHSNSQIEIVMEKLLLENIPLTTPAHVFQEKKTCYRVHWREKITVTSRVKHENIHVMLLFKNNSVHSISKSHFCLLQLKSRPEESHARST